MKANPTTKNFFQLVDILLTALRADKENVIRLIFDQIATDCDKNPFLARSYQSLI